MQLRQIAGALFQRERRNQTLQPTALVNEAGIRLSARRRRPWKSERHFLGAAAEAMRRILVEHARSRNALKRGGSLTRVDLNEVTLRERENPIDILDLHDALDRLQAIDQRKARLVELRFFGGLTINETAESLGLCASTVKQEWAIARAWLKRELSRDE
jgi:RNA polymerase sigma factor (TIGR02999 family)